MRERIYNLRMKEYIDDVLKPVLSSFGLRKVSLGMLVSFIPVLNLFFAPGYVFNASRYLGKGKKEFPDLKIWTSLSIAISTFILIFLFMIFLGFLSLPVSFVLSLFKVFPLSHFSFLNLNFGSLFSFSMFLNTFIALNLLASLFYPMMIVRYQIYNYFTRIFDFYHILKLVFTKEYIFSYIISISTSFVLFYLLGLLGNGPFFYLLMTPFYFLVWLFSFSLYGRTFYILEEKYEIDHIPDHAKSEIQSIEDKDLKD